MSPEQMYKLEATWLDTDSAKHTTLIYTSFEIDDQRAIELIELHAEIVEITQDEIVDFMVTPPTDEQ